MWDLWADLHIHSALSPCAEEEMSPDRMVDAALRAGVAVLAVTDHNAAGNTEAVLAAADRAGLWAIPGMEVQTREEVHLLCFFSSPDALFAWEETLWRVMPDLPNDERFFGRQTLFGIAGQAVGSCSRLLLASADLGVEEVCAEVARLGGICLPAHVDRRSFGLLGQLGLVPPVFARGVPFEISAGGDPDEVRTRFRLDHRIRFFSSSDAHRLAEIGRRPSCLRVAAATWEEFRLAVAGRDGRWLGLERD